MPDYSSESDDDHVVQPARLFSRERSIYAILGVADILLWRDKSLTGSILVGFTITWFLFEIAEFHLITLLCYIMMTLMLVLFLWKHGSDLINRSPPSIKDVQLSDSTVQYVLSKINAGITVLYNISSGQDLASFIVMLASLWIISTVGSYTSFLCMITIPLMYERYEKEADYMAIQGIKDMKKLYRKLDSKVLSKIPRGGVKEKKFK
ncbi:Reticulon-like protein [Drosera capensis]